MSIDHILKESIEGSINAIAGVDDGCEPVDRVKYEESEKEPYNYVLAKGSHLVLDGISPVGGGGSRHFVLVCV
tara:strand:- start:900 stop:1118 length:219 start_codon:yes stop_codon:yes gene_type:complete